MGNLDEGLLFTIKPCSTTYLTATVVLSVVAHSSRIQWVVFVQLCDLIEFVYLTSQKHAGRETGNSKVPLGVNALYNAAVSHERCVPVIRSRILTRIKHLLS